MQKNERKKYEGSAKKGDNGELKAINLTSEAGKHKSPTCESYFLNDL